MSEQGSRSPRGDDRSPGDGSTWRYEGSRDVRRRSRSPVLRRSRSPQREGEKKSAAAPGEEGDHHVALQYDDPTDWLKLRDPVTGQRYHYSPSTGRRFDPTPFPAYNPKVYGDYVNWEQKKKEAEGSDDEYDMPQPAPASLVNYGSAASFNRFNNTFANTAVHPTRTPGAHTGAAKGDRQLKSYYDLDAADEDQSGKSGRAERASRAPTKAEMQMFKQKKEDKRRRNRDALYKD